MTATALTNTSIPSHNCHFFSEVRTFIIYSLNDFQVLLTILTIILFTIYLSIALLSLHKILPGELLA